MDAPSDPVAAEAERIRAEYRRRAKEIDADRYAAWQPAEMLMRVSRRRAAAEMLHAAGAFPGPTDRCLEVGFGSLGWFPSLLDWGVQESALSGIDLAEDRVAVAKLALPSADLRVGDATAMPWDQDTFKLVITSTMFSSILDGDVRRKVAREIVRAMAKDGALLFYDFAFDNPRNKNVTKIDRKELTRLFPDLHGDVKKVTLAPPIARAVAPVSWALATAMELVPFLRTHLIAVLRKA